MKQVCKINSRLERAYPVDIEGARVDVREYNVRLPNGRLTRVWTEASFLLNEDDEIVRSDGRADASELGWLRTLAKALLAKLLPDHCRGCNAPIYWVRMPSGKVAPVTPEGLNHFVDCPKAADFAKRKTQGDPS